jgi:nucleotide-binding universal stress UspA family protein
MYYRMLVALDHTPADDSLIAHISKLARFTGGELLLTHVLTGWASQWKDQLQLEESREAREDRAYLEARAEELQADGLNVRISLLQGEPAREILKLAAAEQCDLIAMTTHGHRFLADLILGSTIEKVRHETDIPILVVRASK